MKALAVSYITGEEGLEPPSTVLETAALPLNYSPTTTNNNSFMISHFYLYVNKIFATIRQAKASVTVHVRSQQLAKIHENRL